MDLAALRGTPAGNKLLQLLPESPTVARLLEDLRTRAGFDVLRDLRSITLALPEDAAASRRFAAVLRAGELDEARLVGYAREQLQRDGGDLTQSPRRGRTLWISRKRPDLAAFLVDSHTIAVAGGGWAETMADLADHAGRGQSLDARQDLIHLCERLSASSHAWLVAAVPASTRQALHRDARFAAAASVSRVGLALGVPSTLELELTADTASETDARALATHLMDGVRDARRNTAVLMLGIAPFLDVVTARADGPVLRARMSLPPAQVDDLVGRLRYALRLERTPRPPGFGGK